MVFARVVVITICYFKCMTEVDPCLFISPDVICLTYVDDCLLFARDPAKIQEVIVQFCAKGMELEEEDDVAGFLGVDMFRGS